MRDRREKSIFRQQPKCGFVRLPDQDADEGLTAEAVAWLLGAIVAHVTVHKGISFVTANFNARSILMDPSRLLAILATRVFESG